MKFDGDTKAFSKFLKIEPNKSVTGVFRGDPLEFACKEVNKKTTPCSPSDPAAKFRFKINFVMKQKDLSYKAFVWEQSGAVYDVLKKFNEDFPLEKTIVKISRDGEGLKTKYSILPNGTNFQVSDELNSALSDVQLVDLKVEATADTEEHQTFPPDDMPSFDANDQVPF